MYVQESITQLKLGDFPKNCDICCPVSGEKDGVCNVLGGGTGLLSECVFGENIDDCKC